MEWGDWRLDVLSDGSFWLDGGAMFGVVPRAIWEKYCPPDDKNRIRLGLKCLLIQTPDEIVLVDTGCGFKYSNRALHLYGIEHATDLLRELRRRGIEPADVDRVINTHLHFDHAGGNTTLSNGKAVPTFPEATYYVQRREFEDATAPHERNRASYFPENWLPVQERGQLELIEGVTEILPGVTCVPTPGHTPGHQSVLLETDQRKLFFIADLCPTTAHVPLAWIMGYDLEPLVTLETRRRIYHQAIEGDWWILFEHDPDISFGKLIEENGKYRAIEVDPEEEIG